MTLPASFLAQVRHEPNGCHTWTGTKTSDGYGLYRLNGGGTTTTTAHRVVYAELVGPIPDGHQIDHLCHVPPCPGGPTCQHRACVNPAHLEAVTQAENTRRAIEHQATVRGPLTHCTRAGHEFTDSNTKWAVIRGKRTRQCRACAREADQRYRARQLGGAA